MRRFTWLAIIPALLALDGSAIGQTARPAVDGTLLVGDDSRDTRLPGLILGGGINLVDQRSPRLSLGLEIDVPATRAYEMTDRIPHADGSTTVLSHRETFRGTMVAAVVGLHVPLGRRVDLAVVTGLGIEQRAFGAATTEETLDVAGTLTGPGVVGASTSSFAWLQVPIGLDAAVALGTHLSLVPEFRFYFDPLALLNAGCCDGSQMRLRVALRWRF